MTALIFMSGLSACSLQPNQADADTDLDGSACVGEIPPAPVGLEEIMDASLLTQARAHSGKGGLCAGKVFSVKQPLRVYRVWDASKPYSQTGRWWSLDKPSGSKDLYRQQYAICPAWSALDRVISCSVKAGTEIVIGTTQSALCGQTLYPKTAALQLYIRNDSTAGQIFMTDCRNEKTLE